MRYFGILFLLLSILNSTSLQASLTPLLVAASVGDESRVRDLLEEGSDIREHNEGINSLHLAAQNGHIGVIEALLDTDPRLIDEVTSEGFTALMLAAQRGKLVAVRLLLERGADRNILNSLGHDAWHYAWVGGHTTMCSLLYPESLVVSPPALPPVVDRVDSPPTSSDARRVGAATDRAWRFYRQD